MEILISAGEASADRYGGAVMEEVRRLRPEARFSGMGGPAMQARGLEVLADARDASVMGFSSVVKRLPALRRAFVALRARAESGRVQGAFLIDFPDFHLRLAAAVRARGVPVVQMVAPQFWAWRPRRVRSLPRLVSRLLCILPFEEEPLRRAGVEARFIGHPLRDLAVPSAPAEEIRRLHRLPLEAPLVGLVPGSRAAGVRRLLPRMAAAAGLLARRRGDLHFLVPVAPTLDRRLVDPLVAPLAPRVHVREGPFTDLASCCAAAVASSGTATLELALLGVPSVIVYRVGGVLAPLARRFLRVEHVGLPNLVAGRRLLPERLQGEFTPARVAADVEACLSDAEGRRLAQELRALRGRLGEPGVLERAAANLLEVLG
jgi:lipid-A-disaccharide synthase